MEEMELEKSSMGFKLPDGSTFLLHNEDIKKIASELLIHIISLNQDRVFLLKDTALEKANRIYEIYQREKDDMSDKEKQLCLSKIIKFLTDNDYELTTLKKSMEEFKKKNP